MVWQTIDTCTCKFECTCNGIMKHLLYVINFVCQLENLVNHTYMYMLKPLLPNIKLVNLIFTGLQKCMFLINLFYFQILMNNRSNCSGYPIVDYHWNIPAISSQLQCTTTDVQILEKINDCKLTIDFVFIRI